MDGRTKVRRRVLACARCRKRKLSCDGKVPACTRCVHAGVACVGFNSSTQREAPRSIADFLEQHIASLELPPSPSLPRPANRPGASFPSPAASPAASLDSAAAWPTDRSTFAHPLVSEAVGDMTPAFLGISQARPILSCIVKGTQLPSNRGPVGAPTDLHENHPRSIINPQPDKAGLDAIDRKIASGLFDNFLDRVITQYPIYHRNDVTVAFNSIYHPASRPGHDGPRNRYIISIIMAISLSTAARTRQKAANAHAYSLVRHALQYIPSVATNDLRGLQAILLLAQYAFLNPAMADVWLLTGLISQAVIDLGLHQELPGDAQISAYQRDMRRRLFWCAWEMEVAVCCIFLRPVSLPIRHIDVAFPVDVDDTAITEACIDLNGRVSKFTSRRIWLFRQIEAEIMAVLWHGEPIPQTCSSLEQWMQKREASVFAWHREVYAAAAANKDADFESSWAEMLLYADIGYPYLLVTLYRPSRRIPEPTVDHLVVAFVNAVHVADGYWRQSNADYGNIKYVFQPCHHVFNAAKVFIQALSRCRLQISERYSFEQIEDFMGRFSRFFSTIAERWPAATRCLEEYERMLAPTKKEYAEYLAQKASYVSKQTTPIGAAKVGDAVFGLYNYPSDLDQALNFWTTSNPTTTTDSVAETLSAYAYNIPHDWKAEFNLNLGIETQMEF